jgi:hypothetical protein
VIGIYLLTAAALVILGIAVGGVTIISLGIRREERDGSLMNQTTDRVLCGARRATGFYAQAPGPAGVRELSKGTAWSSSRGARWN